MVCVHAWIVVHGLIVRIVVLRMRVWAHSVWCGVYVRGVVCVAVCGVCAPHPPGFERVPDVVPQLLIRHLSSQILLQSSQPHQHLLQDTKGNAGDHLFCADMLL